MPAPKYSKELKEAIWACMQDGMTPKEMGAALKNDELGLGQSWILLRTSDGPASQPNEIPYRSLTDIMQKLKQKRGNPQSLVRPGHEASAVDALQRQMLAITRSKIEEAAQKERKGEEFTIKELQVLDQLLKLAASIRKQIKAAEAEEKKDQGMKDLAEQSHDSPRKDLLAKIRQDEAARLEGEARTPDASDEPASDDDAMNGSR